MLYSWAQRNLQVGYLNEYHARYRSDLCMFLTHLLGRISGRVHVLYFQQPVDGVVVQPHWNWKDTRLKWFLQGETYHRYQFTFCLLLERRGNTAQGVNFLRCTGSYYPPFYPPLLVAVAADQSTCLQLVGWNLVQGTSEVKNGVELGLPSPSTWPIHLTNCYWWQTLPAGINWLVSLGKEMFGAKQRVIKARPWLVSRLFVVLPVLESTSCTVQNSNEINIRGSLWISDHFPALPCLFVLLWRGWIRAEQEGFLQF